MRDRVTFTRPGRGIWQIQDSNPDLPCPQVCILMTPLHNLWQQWKFPSWIFFCCVKLIFWCYLFLIYWTIWLSRDSSVLEAGNFPALQDKPQQLWKCPLDHLQEASKQAMGKYQLFFNREGNIYSSLYKIFTRLLCNLLITNRFQLTLRWWAILLNRWDQKQNPD